MLNKLSFKMWFSNADCGCLLIFHVDAIKDQYVKTEG